MIQMKELTKAEEQIMQVLWQLEKGFVKDVIELLPEPKPAYNTVSTIIRILEKKEFVSYKAYGKTYEYFPIVSKEDYKRYTTNNVLKGYFEGSAQKLMSFFMNEKKLSINEIDEIMELIKKQKNDDRK
jgi:BlaI family penicillinase repressor